MGIGVTLRRALAKLVMKEEGEQAKTSCGNLQLCAGLKDSIKGTTHDVVQRILERKGGGGRKRKRMEIWMKKSQG